MDARERRIPDAPDKDPGAQSQLQLSFLGDCGNFWEPNKQYSLGAAVIARPTTGFAYTTSAAGMSGRAPPKWPTTIGATVADGSLTWTCAAASASGAILPISNVSATIEPTGGLAAPTAAVDSTESWVVDVTYPTGGTHGNDYDAVFTYIVNGITRVARQKIRVRRQ